MAERLPHEQAGVRVAADTTRAFTSYNVTQSNAVIPPTMGDISFSSDTPMDEVLKRVVKLEQMIQTNKQMILAMDHSSVSEPSLNIKEAQKKF